MGAIEDLREAARDKRSLEELRRAQFEMDIDEARSKLGSLASDVCLAIDQRDAAQRAVLAARGQLEEAFQIVKRQNDYLDSGALRFAASVLASKAF